MSTEAMQVKETSPGYLAQANAQDVPSGYKRTEIGIIPKDWEAKHLGQIAGLDVGYAFKSAWFSTYDGIPLLRGENVGYGRPDWSDMKRLPPKHAQAYQGYTLRSGDIVIGMDRTFTKSGTKISLLKEIDCPSLLVQRVGRFIPLKCNRGFLWALLSSESFRNSLMVEQKGMDIPHLSRTEILSPIVAVPSFNAEQQAIAEALSDVDGLLEALEALIAKKRAIKQAAMQQLLTGKTRLPGFSSVWETRRLGNHVTFLRNGVNSRAELTRDGSVKYLHYGDIHTSSEVRLDPSTAAMPSLSEVRARSLDRLQDGDLVFADASEDLDGVGRSVEIQGLSEVELVAGLHTIAARFDKAVLADGFKAYLQFCPAFREQLRRLAAGTKVYATNRSHISSVEMRLPNTKEQTAIAIVLSDMDAEIAALETRRNKTRALKQGMMQQLLTGKVRLVKPSKVEAGC